MASPNPPQDSEGVLLALGGRSGRMMFLGGEHKDHRQKDLKTGQAVLYDDKGNVIFAKGSDGISIKSKDSVVEIEAQGHKVTINGQNIYLGGDGTGGGYSKVMTEAGPSANVFAKA
jgi:phage gp45-like